MRSQPVQFAGEELDDLQVDLDAPCLHSGLLRLAPNLSAHPPTLAVSSTRPFLLLFLGENRRNPPIFLRNEKNFDLSGLSGLVKAVSAIPKMRPSLSLTPNRSLLGLSDIRKTRPHPELIRACYACFVTYPQNAAQPYPPPGSQRPAQDSKKALSETASDFFRGGRKTPP